MLGFLFYFAVLKPRNNKKQQDLDQQRFDLEIVNNFRKPDFHVRYKFVVIKRATLIAQTRNVC